MVSFRYIQKHVKPAKARKHRKPIPSANEMQDDILDRRQGIAENTPQDLGIDQSRGLPPDDA